MATLTEALYERMLQLVPRHELQASYNDVLQGEFASLIRAISDVEAAFTKLEEIHDAVTKLQHTTTGQNRSLLASLEDTLTLRSEMERRLEEFAASNSNVERKRKRGDTHSDQVTKHARLSSTVQARHVNTTSSSKSDSGEPVVSGEVDKGYGISNRPDSSSESEVEGSEAAWKAVMMAEPCKSAETGVVIENASKSAQVVATPYSKAATYMQAIVKEVGALSPSDRTLILPEVLATLTESVSGDTGGKQQSQVLNSLQIVVAWVKLNAEQGQHLSCYRDYENAVKKYAQGLPRAGKSIFESSVARLGTALSAYSRLPVTTSESKRPSKLPKCFVKAENSLSKMSVKTRRQNMLKLLVELKKDSALAYRKPKHLLKSVNVVAKWMAADYDHPQTFQHYRLLVSALRGYIKLVLNRKSSRAPLLDLTDRMWEMTAATQSPKAQEFLVQIQDRFARVAKEIEQMKDKKVSADIFDRMVAELGSVINHLTRGWQPRKDRKVYECVTVLKAKIPFLTGVNEQLSDSRRNQRLRTIANWNLQIKR